MLDSPARGRLTSAADQRLLVSYDNYAAAQRTVDTLSDAGFPVETATIVGTDLRLEETVTGRLTNGRAALTGLITGAVFGFVVGLFLGLFTTTTTSFIWLVLWSILWGAIAGAAFGFVSHAFTGGVRDFSSRSSIVAGRYDVLVGASVLDRAQALLQGGLAPADTVVVERPPTAGPAAGAKGTATGPEMGTEMGTDRGASRDTARYDGSDR
ncbi:general stress protein [Sphaerimonospora mesophila]|uniref:general stress protein n=1 Tax=Sphaerimonospora mesophila TaxID=37483 RepID=UPI0007C6594A